MGGTYARLYTKSPGDAILSSERNDEHQNHIDNADPDGIGDASANTTEFRATKLPSVGSLPVKLREDLQTLRYQVLQLMKLLKPAITTWDEVPAFLSAVLTTPQINDISKDHQYVFGVNELTANRTITLPLLTGNDVFVFKNFIQTLTNKTLTSPVINTSISGTAFLDEDNMDSDSAVKVASQQSIKAYADSVGVTNSDAHNHSGGDGAAIPQGGLKTADSSISIGGGSGANLVLPGGEYGFYPQTRIDNDLGSGSLAIIKIFEGTVGASTDTGRVAHIHLSSDDALCDVYAYQRYIQASPPYKIGNKAWGHFLYMLVNSNGDVIASYEAEDPPYAYNGTPHNAKDSIERMQAVPHPFIDYFDKDPAIDGLEIVLVDLRLHNTKKWKADNAKQGKGILEDLGRINKKGKIVTPQELGIGNIQGFTDRVKIRKHN